MGGMAIGPLVFSAERAPFVVALLVLFLSSGLLARRYGGGVSAWAVMAVFWGVLAARLAFVIAHFQDFMAAPLSIFAFWQGGFVPWAGVVGFALGSIWHFRRDWQGAMPAGAALLLAAVSWNMVHQMSAAGDVALPQNMQLLRMDGTEFSTADWQGKPMVINLWASWCPPCRREMPMMVDVAGQQSEVAIHFVNQGEGPEAIRKFLSQAGLVMHPVMDNGQQMMRHFDAMGLPATLFVDADGRVASAHMGEISRAGLLSGIDALQRP